MIQVAMLLPQLQALVDRQLFGAILHGVEIVDSGDDLGYGLIRLLVLGARAGWRWEDTFGGGPRHEGYRDGVLRAVRHRRGADRLADQGTRRRPPGREAQVSSRLRAC